MAKAKVTMSAPEYVLTLSERETTVLVALLSMIGGSPTGPRGEIQKVLIALTGVLEGKYPDTQTIIPHVRVTPRSMYIGASLEDVS